MLWTFWAAHGQLESTKSYLDSRIVGVHISTYAWEVPRVCMFQLDKIPREEMESELAKVNVPNEAIEGILKALTLKSLDDLEG